MRNEMTIRIAAFALALVFVLPMRLFAQATPTPAPSVVLSVSSVVSGTVPITCTPPPGGSVGIYIDDVYMSGSPYSWDTTTVANGLHTVLCNGYLVVNGVKGSAGAASQSVTVYNPTPTPTATPAPTASPTAVPPIPTPASTATP